MEIPNISWAVRGPALTQVQKKLGEASPLNQGTFFPSF